MYNIHRMCRIRTAHKRVFIYLIMLSGLIVACTGQSPEEVVIEIPSPEPSATALQSILENTDTIVQAVDIPTNTSPPVLTSTPTNVPEAVITRVTTDVPTGVPKDLLTNFPVVTETNTPDVQIAIATATELPTLTVTSAPTNTNTPAPTNVAFALPDPLPFQVGPSNYPAEVNPLTGLPVADASVLTRRPIAIKVSNAPDCVRPQEGLSRADIVYEHYAEGGTTRYTAVFYGDVPARVGSVRSARLIDMEIPAMHGAIFAYSGAAEPVKIMLEESDFGDRVIANVPGHPAFYRKSLNEVACGRAEHTLFTDPVSLRNFAASTGINDTRPNISGLIFNPEVPTGGQQLDSLVIRYLGVTNEWRYSSTLDQYTRYSNGSQNTDLYYNVPILADNVVVLYANHVTTLILEDRVGYNAATGTGGNYSIEAQIWGNGPLMFMRNGQVYTGTWFRSERDQGIVLTDNNGNILGQKPGRTWYQVVPLDTPLTQTSATAWSIKPERPPAQPER